MAIRNYKICMTFIYQILIIHITHLVYEYEFALSISSTRIDTLDVHILPDMANAKSQIHEMINKCPKITTNPKVNFIGRQKKNWDTP